KLPPVTPLLSRIRWTSLPLPVAELLPVLTPETGTLPPVTRLVGSTVSGAKFVPASGPPKLTSMASGDVEPATALTVVPTSGGGVVTEIVAPVGLVTTPIVATSLPASPPPNVTEYTVAEAAVTVTLLPPNMVLSPV